MRDYVLFGDCRDSLKIIANEAEKARMCVTSPPYYGLRDYGGEENQIGQEQSPEQYVEEMVKVFSLVRDCLTDDGTLWLNIGDSYYNYRKDGCIPKQTFSSNRQDLPVQTPRRSNKLVGYKDKDLIGIPWMLAFALRADGWYLRQDIIWHKPNPMPESVRDRCTKAHEYIFL
ncbi:MAG: site-specific DNA-methyltransferase, partial [Pseudomonadota bacterium]|nr:site-specific DNA-methyltransferase [Pseudomonadota bacterium]